MVCCMVEVCSDRTVYSSTLRSTLYVVKSFLFCVRYLSAYNVYFISWNANFTPEFGKKSAGLAASSQLPVVSNRDLQDLGHHLQLSLLAYFDLPLKNPRISNLPFSQWQARGVVALQIQWKKFGMADWELVRIKSFRPPRLPAQS